MSRFAQVYEPVSEGWGKVLASMTIVGNLVHAYVSAKEAEKILANPKVQKYIVGECDKLLKEVKKQGYSNECEINKVNWSRGKAMSSNMGFKNYIFNNLQVMKKIGKYWIACVGDTDHIEKIAVFFMNKDEKFISRVIPAPTKDEIKALGFRKEDSFD